ncbi:jg11666 [Pararge aegeria aegeria]|uniref:Jg11666 protein n=1 Tax=Pararge aegeria aegeria TaxID=348720 RepID=A0A8S4S383_9NEOP|nr:jg11666 [Pararge aegeria aegeria]
MCCKSLHATSWHVCRGLVNAKTRLTVRPTKPPAYEVAGSITLNRDTIRRWLFCIVFPRFLFFRFLYLEPVVPSPCEPVCGGFHGGSGGVGIGGVGWRGGFGATQERTPLLRSLLAKYRMTRGEERRAL